MIALSRARDCLLCPPKCVCWCTTTTHSLECLIVLHVHVVLCVRIYTVFEELVVQSDDKG